MSEPSDVNDHVKHILSIALMVEEDHIESNVEIIELEDGKYLCCLSVMLDGKDLTQRQSNMAVHALKYYGLPGVRITDVQIAAEA